MRAIMNIPFDTITSHVIPSRTVWVRLNRVLAWAMLVAPIVELACQISLATSLLADLVLMLAHGILSLLLFGVPKLKGQKFSFSMHIMGIRATGMSARNTFLLSGYRIALPIFVLSLGFVSPWFLLLSVLTLYPFLRWGISMIQHIHLALKYALQRNRVAPTHADWIVALYLGLWLANVFH